MTSVLLQCQWETIYQSIIRETKGILTASIMATRPYFCYFSVFWKSVKTIILYNTEIH